MTQRAQLIGEVFGRLTVIEDAGNHNRHSMWKCLCECGNICVVPRAHLLDGHARSCGCLRIYLGRLQFFKHGMTHTKSYKQWCNMKERCSNPLRSDWKNYGGRGITVCARWQDSFEAFFEDMGECFSGLSLDRIDNDGNYEPGNCRWATKVVQANNTRYNRHISVGSETHTLSAWGRLRGIDPDTISMRIVRGWPADRAINTPKMRYWSRRKRKSPRGSSSC